ncbi:MAG: tetratricopeptide repeat protein [Candidatus Omnitrophota bacterium]
MTINRASLKGLSISIVLFAVFALTGCKGPQGPSFNDQVKEALNHYYKGDKLERNGDLKGAREEYEASIAISPRPMAYYSLAQVLAAQEQYDEAEKCLDAAIRLSPGFKAVAQRKMQIQIMRRSSAGETLKIDQTPAPTVSAEPEKKSALPPAAETPKTKTTAPAVEKTTPAEAAPASPKKTEAEPLLDAENQTLYNQAKDAISAGNWPLTVELCQRILEKDPQQPIVLYNLGFAHIHLNQYEEAEKAFRRVTELDPAFADAYNDLGVVLEYLGRSGEASQAYDKAIQAGNRGDAYFNLAHIKEKSGEYKEAISLFEKYLQFEGQGAYAEHARQRIEKLRRMAY